MGFAGGYRVRVTLFAVAFRGEWTGKGEARAESEKIHPKEVTFVIDE